MGQCARCRQQFNHPALFGHAQGRRHQRLAFSGANSQWRRRRRIRPMTTKQKFTIVSLGCARNLVDSEVMAGVLQSNNYEIVSDPADADVVMVNTCGFIGAAKEESIDTIVEMGRLKESGSLKKLVVAGCLSQRYPTELAAELSEVDLFIGTGEVP